MIWRPDISNLPIKKPKEIEILEQMDRSFLDSMPPLEVNEKVQEIAHAVARSYKKDKKDANFDECLSVVSTALKLTGSAIGGQVGNSMIAAKDSAALIAAQDTFPDDQSEF